MDRFSKSVSQLIDYKKLAYYLYHEMDRSNIFVDLGSGDCSLIRFLNKDFNIECIGIDIDKTKIEISNNNGFSVFWGDVRNFFTPKYVKGRNLSLHAGFCLFNIFPLHEVVETVVRIFKNTEVKELFFEIQNSSYFKIKYPPKKIAINNFNDLTVKSWNEPFSTANYFGVDLIMEFYSKNHKIINKTKDRIYSHDVNVVFHAMSKIRNVTIDLIKWPVRYDVESEISHFYFLIKRR